MAGLATTLGSGAMTNAINEIEGAELLLLMGTNTTVAHPIVGYKMRQAVRRGCKLVVVDPRRTELADEADLWLGLKPGTDISLLNGMMHIILREGWEDKAFIDTRTENVEVLKEIVKKYTPAYVAERTGISEDDLYKAARLYAQTDKAMIFYTLGITEHVCGTQNVMSIANLAMLTGHIGRPGTGVCPLRGQNNVQGACDMGALPDVYPGYQKVVEPVLREKFQKAWKAELSDQVGLRIPEMFDKANQGEIKAMFIMGENPVLSDPNSNHIRAGLEKLEFLVVHELFLTETARYADVILPASSFAENDGTFTNTERRVQRVRQAVSPLQGKTNWETLAELARRLGLPCNYAGPAEIFAEMASLTPSMAGMNYERLEEQGLQWPCPTCDHPGTAYLHAEAFTRGKGCFQPAEHVPPAELPDQEYPYLLSTGRILYHYNVTTAYSDSIQGTWSKEQLQMHPNDASRLRIKSGDKVKVSSRRGEVTSSVIITDTVAPGTVWMSFHYAETPTNVLTSEATDPITRTGAYKIAAVRIEPIRE